LTIVIFYLILDNTKFHLSCQWYYTR